MKPLTFCFMLLTSVCFAERTPTVRTTGDYTGNSLFSPRSAGSTPHNAYFVDHNAGFQDHNAGFTPHPPAEPALRAPTARTSAVRVASRPTGQGQLYQVAAVPGPAPVGAYPGRTPPRGSAAPSTKNPPAADSSGDNELLEKIRKVVGDVAHVSADINDDGNLTSAKVDYTLCGLYDHGAYYESCSTTDFRENRKIRCRDDEGDVQEYVCDKRKHPPLGLYAWTPTRKLSKEQLESDLKTVKRHIRGYAKKNDLSGESLDIPVGMPPSVKDGDPCSSFEFRPSNLKIMKECYGKGIVTSGGLGPLVRPGERVQCVERDEKTMHTLVCRKDSVTSKHYWTVLERSRQ